MVTNRSIHFRRYWLGFTLVIGLASCASGSYYAGPSSHAQYAHYHPYGYYYYPSVRVYFNYTTGYYYYPSGPYWTRTRTLPAKFRLDPRDRKTIHIDNDKPYAKHFEHRNKYQPHPDYRPDARQDRAERKQHEKTYKKYKDKRK